MDDITLQQPPDQTSAPAADPAPAQPAPIDQFHDAMSDPTFLRKAAVLALQNGLPEGVSWLAHAHQAVQENGVRAAQALIAGDGDRAVKLWNQSGVHTDATGATRNDDGTWTITRKSGAPVTVDPQREMASFLSPQAYLTQQTASKKAAAEAEELGARAKYYTGAAAFQGERADIEREKLAQQATIADLRNQSQELQKTITAFPRVLQATKDESNREYSQKYGLAAFLKDRAQAYATGTAQLPPDPSDPDGKRTMNPDAQALMDAMRNPTLVDYQVNPSGAVRIVDRANPKNVLRAYPNAQAMQAELGIAPNGGAAPAPKQPGFLERNLPYLKGLTTPTAPPAPATEKPAAKGVTTVGDDLRRLKRLFTGDDEAQRTATGKIR